jgi:4-hydroxybenzoate polyprenyltransferase
VFTLAVGVFAVLAAVATHHPVSPARLLRLLGGVYCTQVAIGAVNDYHDRALDAASGRAKPIARGLIAPWEALALALVATLILVAAVAPLGWLALALTLVIEALGLAYDLRFKGTPVSALLYAVYFPLNPLLAWVVFGHWQPFLPWLLPLGAAMGIVTNISNSLPDLEADRLAGVRGLPHLLGFRWGLRIVWSAPLFMLAVVWALALTGAVPARWPPLLAGTVAGVLATLLVIVRYQRRPTPQTLRLNFTIQAIGTVALAAGWLAAVAF